MSDDSNSVSQSQSRLLSPSTHAQSTTSSVGSTTTPVFEPESSNPLTMSRNACPSQQQPPPGPDQSASDSQAGHNTNPMFNVGNNHHNSSSHHSLSFPEYSVHHHLPHHSHPTSSTSSSSLKSMISTVSASTPVDPLSISSMYSSIIKQQQNLYYSGKDSDSVLNSQSHSQVHSSSHVSNVNASQTPPQQSLESTCDEKEKQSTGLFTVDTILHASPSHSNSTTEPEIPRPDSAQNITAPYTKQNTPMSSSVLSDDCNSIESPLSVDSSKDASRRRDPAEERQKLRNFRLPKHLSSNKTSSTSSTTTTLTSNIVTTSTTTKSTTSKSETTKTSEVKPLKSNSSSNKKTTVSNSSTNNIHNHNHLTNSAHQLGNMKPLSAPLLSTNQQAAAAQQFLNSSFLLPGSSTFSGFPYPFAANPYLPTALFGNQFPSATAHPPPLPSVSSVSVGQPSSAPSVSVAANRFIQSNLNPSAAQSPQLTIFTSPGASGAPNSLSPFSFPMASSAHLLSPTAFTSGLASNAASSAAAAAAGSLLIPKFSPTNFIEQQQQAAAAMMMFNLTNHQQQQHLKVATSASTSLSSHPQPPFILPRIVSTASSLPSSVNLTTLSTPPVTTTKGRPKIDRNAQRLSKIYSKQFINKTPSVILPNSSKSAGPPSTQMTPAILQPQTVYVYQQPPHVSSVMHSTTPTTTTTKSTVSSKKSSGRGNKNSNSVAITSVVNTSVSNNAIISTSCVPTIHQRSSTSFSPQAPPSLIFQQSQIQPYTFFTPHSASGGGQTLMQPISIQAPPPQQTQPLLQPSQQNNPFGPQLLLSVISPTHHSASSPHPIQPSLTNTTTTNVVNSPKIAPKTTKPIKPKSVAQKSKPVPAPKPKLKPVPVVSPPITSENIQSKVVIEESRISVQSFGDNRTLQFPFLKTIVDPISNKTHLPSTSTEVSVVPSESSSLSSSIQLASPTVGDEFASLVKSVQDNIDSFNVDDVEVIDDLKLPSETTPVLNNDSSKKAILQLQSSDERSNSRTSDEKRSNGKKKKKKHKNHKKHKSNERSKSDEEKKSSRCSIKRRKSKLEIRDPKLLERIEDIIGKFGSCHVSNASAEFRDSHTQLPPMFQLRSKWIRNLRCSGKLVGPWAKSCSSQSTATESTSRLPLKKRAHRNVDSDQETTSRTLTSTPSMTSGSTPLRRRANSRGDRPKAKDLQPSVPNGSPSSGQFETVVKQQPPPQAQQSEKQHPSSILQQQQQQLQQAQSQEQSRLSSATLRASGVTTTPKLTETATAAAGLSTTITAPHSSPSLNSSKTLLKEKKQQQNKKASVENSATNVRSKKASKSKEEFSSASSSTEDPSDADDESSETEFDELKVVEESQQEGRQTRSGRVSTPVPQEKLKVLKSKKPVNNNNNNKAKVPQTEQYDSSSNNNKNKTVPLNGAVCSSPSSTTTRDVLEEDTVGKEAPTTPSLTEEASKVAILTATTTTTKKKRRRAFNRTGFTKPRKKKKAPITNSITVSGPNILEENSSVVFKEDVDEDRQSVCPSLKKKPIDTDNTEDETEEEDFKPLKRQQTKMGGIPTQNKKKAFILKGAKPKISTAQINNKNSKNVVDKKKKKISKSNNVVVEKQQQKLAKQVKNKNKKKQIVEVKDSSSSSSLSPSASSASSSEDEQIVGQYPVFMVTKPSKKSEKKQKVLPIKPNPFQRSIPGKKFYKCGIFSNDFSNQHTEDVGMLKSLKNYEAGAQNKIANSILPVPSFLLESHHSRPTGKRNKSLTSNNSAQAPLSEFDDGYKLSFDIWYQYKYNPLPEIMKSSNYRRVRQNVFVDAKPTVPDANEKCNCLYPSNPNDPACGEKCENRMFEQECRPTTCPTKNSCSNQRIQRYEWWPGLQRFMTVGRGWGIRTTEKVPEGVFIMEYIGEVCSNQLFEKRMSERYEGDQHHYSLQIDSKMVIDGYRVSNEGRFVNHSCEPNCEIQKWAVNGFYRMCLFSTRPIEEGEELCYDYKFDNYGSKQECKCGSSKCRGVLGKINETNKLKTDAEDGEETKEDVDSKKPRTRKKVLELLAEENWDKKLPKSTSEMVMGLREYLFYHPHTKTVEVQLSPTVKTTVGFDQDIVDRLAKMKPLTHQARNIVAKKRVFLLRNYDQAKRFANTFASSSTRRIDSTKQAQQLSKNRRNLCYRNGIDSSSDSDSAVQNSNVDRRIAKLDNDSVLSLTLNHAKKLLTICKKIDKFANEKLAFLLQDDKPVNGSLKRKYTKSFASENGYQIEFFCFETILKIIQSSPMMKMTTFFETVSSYIHKQIELMPSDIENKKTPLKRIKLSVDSKPPVEGNDSSKFIEPILSHEMIQTFKDSMEKFLKDIWRDVMTKKSHLHSVTSVGTVKKNLSEKSLEKFVDFIKTFSPSKDMVSEDKTKNSPSVAMTIENPHEEKLGCICGILREEGKMIQCDRCQIWQHYDCVEQYCSFNPTELKEYLCEACGHRKVPIDIILPNSHTTPNMDVNKQFDLKYYLSMESPVKKGMQIKVGDCVYIYRAAQSGPKTPVKKSQETNQQGSTGSDFIQTLKQAAQKAKATWNEKFNTRHCIIVRVQHMALIQSTGQKIIFGHHYIWPSETYHEPNRKFYDNEVLKSPVSEWAALEEVRGICFVVDPTTFIKGRPVGFKDENIFICENRVDRAAKSFSRIPKASHFPVNTKSYAFEFYENKLTIKRTYSPHHIPENIVVKSKSKTQDESGKTIQTEYLKNQQMIRQKKIVRLLKFTNHIHYSNYLWELLFDPENNATLSNHSNNNSSSEST